MAPTTPPKNLAQLRQSNAEANRITRESLGIALISLMEQKPFEKITITELVQRAGVSRTAFYRNYATKEALLGEICTSITTLLQDSLRSPQFLQDPHGWYAQWFQSIRDHAPLVRLLGKANLFANSIHGAASILEETFPSHSLAQHYAFVAMEGAIFAAVSHWMAGGMAESVAFMAEFCTRLHEQVFAGDSWSAVESSE